MFLVQHLQKKCNTLTCLDYVINNHVSFEENEELVNQLAIKRIELTTENLNLTVDHLIEFFECTYVIESDVVSQNAFLFFFRFIISEKKNFSNRLLFELLVIERKLTGNLPVKLVKVIPMVRTI